MIWWGKYNLCRKPIKDNWWKFCGASDMGSVPVICEECHKRLKDQGVDVSRFGKPLPLKNVDSFGRDNDSYFINKKFP